MGALITWEVPIILLAIALPVYLLIRWIIAKLKIGRAEHRKYLAIVLALILSPLIYIFLILTLLGAFSTYPQNSFEQQRWQEDIETRYTMSKDVIDSKMLIGLTKQEAVSRLGSDYTSNGSDQIMYYLGFPPGGLSIDPYVLHIYFKSGIVVSVAQHEN